MARHYVSPFVAGALFGVGLILAGMTQPSKVIGFLDFFSGAWDPSLAFVMGGALLVFAPLQARIRKRREAPLFAQIFQVPERRDIDPNLLIGAALFGVGWGLGGYCPGPALTSLASGGSALTFAGAMVAGMVAHHWLVAKPGQRRQRAREPLASSLHDAGAEGR